jgi:DNA-binding CsgD family transcriptional regulator
MAPSIWRDPEVLFGRELETTVVKELLSGVSDRGDALVIRGDPGIGKTALLGAASRYARTNGFQVLTATGVQSEAELPFAGLHQLTRALRWDPNALPEPQRNAVQAAFGRTTSSTPDLFLVALATLDVLAEAAAHHPVLVVAEDAQWLDGPTTEVLKFVARRVEADPIVMLFAVREGGDSALLDAGLPELRLSGLGEADAVALLGTRAPDLDASIRRQILDEACGNPLALVELPAALPSVGEDRSGVSDPLPLTARLERAFTTRLDDLPAATRAVLLAAALNDGSDLSEAVRGARLIVEEPVSLGSLDAAVTARLVHVDGAELQFRHPLIRSAISRSAGLADRLAGHSALAAVIDHDPDRRAWHRASALIGRSEEVAGELDQVAARARAQGAVIVSTKALQRAAELSPDPARRVERLLRAAELAFEAGRRNTVSRLVRDVEPLMRHVHTPLEHGRLTLVRGLGEPRVLQTGRLESLVALAAAARKAGDRNLAWNLLWRLAQRCFWADPGLESRRLVVEAAEAATDDDPREIAILAYAAPLERANIVIDRISSWPIENYSAEEARLLGSAAVVVGAFELSSRFHERAVAGLRKQGRLAHLARALAMQGWSAICLADWTVAFTALSEAVVMASETGEAVWGAGAEAMQAILAAVRGEPDSAAALAHQAERAVIAAGATHMLAYIQVARGLTALGEGRASDAYAELHRIYDPGDPSYHRVPCCWYIGDLAEAAAYSGRGDEVRSLLQGLEALVAPSKSSWIRSAFSYAHAQLAGDSDAEAAFQRALADATHWPFQRARLQLSYGGWLRRRRRVADARAALRSARDAFDALGATPWAARARHELRAAGETSRQRTWFAWDQLSPQEMQIAAMAAEGMSNREIGQRLYLSHRTVGSHLYRLFPKLGVTSRTQLVAALARA